MAIAAPFNHLDLQRLLSKPDALPMVFDYIDGESLRTYLRRRGPLPIDDVLRIGCQFAEALQNMHGQAIVHREVYAKREPAFRSPELKA